MYLWTQKPTIQLGPSETQLEDDELEEGLSASSAIEAGSVMVAEDDNFWGPGPKSGSEESPPDSEVLKPPSPPSSHGGDWDPREMESAVNASLQVQDESGSEYNQKKERNLMGLEDKY